MVSVIHIFGEHPAVAVRNGEARPKRYSGIYIAGSVEFNIYFAVRNLKVFYNLAVVIAFEGNGDVIGTRLNSAAAVLIGVVNVLLQNLTAAVRNGKAGTERLAGIFVTCSVELNIYLAFCYLKIFYDLAVVVAFEGDGNIIRARLDPAGAVLVSVIHIFGEHPAAAVRNGKSGSERLAGIFVACSVELNIYLAFCYLKIFNDLAVVVAFEGDGNIVCTRLDSAAAVLIGVVNIFLQNLTVAVCNGKSGSERLAGVFVACSVELHVHLTL